MENQLSHVLAFKDKGYLAYSKTTMSKAAHDKLREEFSKAYFPVRNQKETSNKRHDASTVIRTFIVSNNDQNSYV